MLRLAKPYISLRKWLSPVQRHTSATALGNFTVSSVLKSFVFVPSGFVVTLSWPKYTEPSDTVSCTTIPELWLRMSEMSRSAIRWSSIVWNWPSATAANAVYSPSVANIHG